MARFHCPLPLHTGDAISLPPAAARHVQVLRFQPGDGLTLFNGEGGEFEATVTRMGRSDVDVLVGAHHALEREASRRIHLLAGVTANERMDWLVEKATELGAVRLTPLSAERSVLKLQGERAEKKRAHWQAVAVAASEQSGRNRVMPIDPACSLAASLASLGDAGGLRVMLSLTTGAQPLQTLVADHSDVMVLSGPEGGLTPAEEALALAAGFVPVSLGSRVLRAETAPLAVLAALTL